MDRRTFVWGGVRLGRVDPPASMDVQA